MIDLSEKYRLKAVICENLGLKAPDPAIALAWAEIAIEWHALSFRVSQDLELEVEADGPV